MRLVLSFLLLVTIFIPDISAENLPSWLIPLREVVYEQQLNADEVRPVYQTAKISALEQLTGNELFLAFSRCEYLMGRALQFDGRFSEAAPHYAEGINYAERVIETAPNAEAWVLMAENLSQSCVVRSTSFAIANGLNVEKYAKNALGYNSRNAAAQHIIAARWVYAPSPLHNYRRGIEMMEAILKNGDMEKDDRFNVYVAIAYAYVQQRKTAEAGPWIERALEIYPTNKFAKELLTTRRR